MEGFAPLDGFRVLTLAVNLPGPVAAAKMAELGARVVKIEPPSGDPLALAHKDLYIELHQRVEVRTADLKSSDGKAELEAVLAETDLLLTSSRLAALDRLGLGCPALGERFPKLCHVAIVGSPPPREHHPGHDLTYQAQVGLVAPPNMPRSLFADLGGAMDAVQAAMGLLLIAFRKGFGDSESRRRLVSLEEAADYYAQPIEWGLTKAGGWLGGGLPQYNVYPASDGWIALAALEPHFWQRLCTEFGLEHPTYTELESLFRERSAQDWQSWASQKDLPIVAVRT